MKNLNLWIFKELQGLTQIGAGGKIAKLKSQYNPAPLVYVHRTPKFNLNELGDRWLDVNRPLELTGMNMDYSGVTSTLWGPVKQRGVLIKSVWCHLWASEQWHLVKLCSYEEYCSTLYWRIKSLTWLVMLWRYIPVQWPPAGQPHACCFPAFGLSMFRSIRGWGPKCQAKKKNAESSQWVQCMHRKNYWLN